MKPLEIIGYCIFLVGISFKFLHFPGAPIFMMLGCLLLLIDYLKILTKKENRNLTVFFTGLASTFWLIYLLFRFQYWSFISIPQLIGLGLTIVAIVFFFKNKTFIKIQGIQMFSLFIITTVLAYTPTHKIYYLVNLSEPLNNDYRADNYRAWDKYSWFLYSAGEYEKSLNANIKAIDAANNTIKKGYASKSILIELNSNKKNIQNRTW